MHRAVTNLRDKAISGMDVSFLIVNYNSAQLLKQLLSSLKTHCSGFTYEIVIVDNASKEDDKKILLELENADDCKVIFSPENLGFGKANNLGLSSVNGTYLVLLNPDTLFTENTVANVIAFRKTLDNPLAIIGVKLVNADGSWQISKQTYPRVVDTLTQAFFLDTLFKGSKYFDRQYYRWQPDNHSGIVESVRGAFMFMETAAFKQLDGFDEDFFIYTEETDLCYRANEAGTKVYHFADTRIVHLEGQSMNLNRLKTWVELYKTKILFARKHYGFMNAIALRAALAISAFNRGILNFTKGILLLSSSAGEKAKVYFLSALWLVGIPISKLSGKITLFSE